MKEKEGKITSPNYPNLPTSDFFQKVGVLNGPKGSRFELTFTDLDLDDNSCGRYSQTIYLFDGLPSSDSLYDAQYIAVIYGGNIITNQGDLKHTSGTNVVSVWMRSFDFGDYDYYNYYNYDYYYYQKSGRSHCSDFEQTESFRGFRLDWKRIE